MMMKSFLRFAQTSLVATIALYCVACETKAATAGETGPAQTKTDDALSPAASQSLKRVLDSYERLRAQLARDEILATTGTAETLAREARDGSASLPKNLRRHVQQLARAADGLKKMPKQDADEVRRSFGHVSEAVVALFVAEPSLRAGRYLFECPMAQGYKKWVQSSSRISNPYMGTRMLECGSPSKWD